MYRLEKISLDMAPAIKQAGITYSYLVRFGSAEDEILNLVNELSIDMVIMGTGGAEGFAKLFGTLSANIIVKASCPVLVIPPNTTFRKIDEIVYATDIQGNDESVIDYIISFAKVFNAHISFLNIRKQDDQNVDEIIPYRARIHTLTDYKNMSFQVIGNEQILDGVNSFAIGIKADLVVMATEKRNFIQTIFSRSKTKAVAYETKIPLLAMHKDELK